MKLLDRLRRGVRIFRVQPDNRELVAELRGIRVALQAIVREGWGVELAPATTAKPPKGADKPYFEYGGADDLTRVKALMAEAGLELDEPGGEPEFEGVSLEDAPPPFPAFVRGSDGDEEQETDDDESSERIPTARRATAHAGALPREEHLSGEYERDAADVDGETDGVE